MKKIAFAVLVFTMIIFLVNPLSGNARVGYWGGGYWGWWAPWAVIGGAAVVAPYYYAPYYSPYYVPAPAVIREQPPNVWSTCAIGAGNIGWKNFCLSP